MTFLFMLSALCIVSIAGAVTAGVQAASPGLGTMRRWELSILSGLLAVVGLCLASLLYWLWGFALDF